MLAAVAHQTHFWLHPISHFFGFDNLSGPFYGFWSGAGSDIQEVTLLGAVLVLARHTNCHVHRCWRLGRHHVEGTPYKTCRRHHPAIPDKVTAEHVHAAHRKAAA